jgi:formylglycine-generating enzyme required for sulfatase activity
MMGRGDLAATVGLMAALALFLPDPVTAAPAPAAREFENLAAAITDLHRTYGEEYPNGQAYLERLRAIQVAAKQDDPAAAGRFRQLKREALLANPLLNFDQLLVVKRRSRRPGSSHRKSQRWHPGRAGRDLGLPSNHECNSSLPREGYDNEIALLAPVRPSGRLEALYRPTDEGYVGEIDLHWDADRLLLTRSDRESWKIWEIRTDGTGLRQVSQAPPDVDCFDACYLPDGRIVFGSTASYQSVPCWHGRRRVANLYLMNADGTGMRQLCFDQDHDFHPTVLPNGQVLFHRWDYTGINHIFMRQLMVMNPDGTGQRAVYGSNSWFPNALYFPRSFAGRSSRLICILSGYHGTHRMGQLVLVDTDRGWYEADGLIRRISGRGDPIKPVVRDQLVDNDWPKFLHPFPLSEKYYLVACLPAPDAEWGIYLADVFDNLVLLRREPDYALLEPIPVKRVSKPPVIADRVDLSREDAFVYLHDVYAGPGLRGVPRGTVKRLRVFAYHFGYRGLAGPDKIGRGGPWEAMRILGTVPLEGDGSAVFRVPANTPIAVQPLDADGKALQLMRSWFTAMPGEELSCVGCHEPPAETPPVRTAAAARRAPRDIEPWYGPPRGFDFEREVQPVLDRYCVGCHNGPDGSPPDLRPTNEVLGYGGKPFSDLGKQRLHPKMWADTRGIGRYTPAYDALIPYIRRVGIEDDVSLLVPGEYHADTSELVQMLRKGHQGVRLDEQAWDRIITWIDLNAPCHGTWGEVYPIPDDAHERRMALRRRYGGPTADPEAIPRIARPPTSPIKPTPAPKAKTPTADGWPFDAAAARRRQRSTNPYQMSIDLGEGVALALVRIPPGQFVMGSATGGPDERPMTRIHVRQAFWIGACEVTNEQFRRFDPDHDRGYYAKRHARSDDRGLWLNRSKQPVVRVSWHRAAAFCQWLAERTGMPFRLPTEAEWEYACRAGTEAPLGYGHLDNDFASWANLADRSFSKGLVRDGKQVTGGLEHLVLEGAQLADHRFDDGAVVTTDVGRYRPNAWGLHDMHGNAAEWTLTTYRAYPYRDDDGRNAPTADGRKVVRGGSFFDRPSRCRSAFRVSYPFWQRVFNVGFRVACGPLP